VAKGVLLVAEEVLLVGRVVFVEVVIWKLLILNHITRPAKATAKITPMPTPRPSLKTRKVVGGMACANCHFRHCI
jgi:hypothetical protein